MLQSLIFNRTLSRYVLKINSINKRAVNDLIYNEKKHIVAMFKDFLILNESCDFFTNYYSLFESLDILGKILFCERNNLFKPCYTPLVNVLPIMLRNKYKKDKMQKILAMDDKTEEKIINDDLDAKMINSSLVAESMAISQYSEQALFLNDKDKISKGCFDFMERHEINQLFSTNCNDEDRQQVKLLTKYEKNPKLSKKKHNKVNGNENSNINGSNKTIPPIKTINQLVQGSTRRNKGFALSQGFQFKSIRKSSLTLDNNENDVFVNHNFITTQNHISNNKQIPISLRYENNNKIHNKISSLNNTNANNNKNSNVRNLHPNIVHKTVRNTLNNKLKKSKTFSKNETMEALSLLQKEKQLLLNRMKKPTSPISNKQKTGPTASYSIKKTNKKYLQIDTEMHLSQNPKPKHHSSMMKLNPTPRNSKNVVISTFNSATITSRIGTQINTKSTTVTSTKTNINSINNNNNNNSKVSQSQKVSITFKNRNSAQKHKDIFLSLSKEIHPPNKRNSNNLPFKLKTVETNYPRSIISEIKKGKVNKNYVSVGSERRSKTMSYNHVESSASLFKKSEVKVIVNNKISCNSNKSNEVLSSNNKIIIIKTQKNQSYQLQVKKNSSVTLKKPHLKQIFKKP